MMNDAIALLRARSLPLVVVYHEDRELGPGPGTRAFAFHESIDVRDSDPRVVKNYPNAFNKTPLADMLKDMGCDTVFILGLSAVGCAMATCHGTIDHDLEPYFAQGGVAADTEEHIRMAEEICRTISLRDLEARLG